MGKDKLYFLTFISILLVFLLIASIGVSYSVKISVNLLLEMEYDASKKEVQKLAYILKQQLNTLPNKATLIDDFQEVLEEIELGTSYTVILNKDNQLVCHPKMATINNDYVLSSNLNKAVNQGVKLGHIHSLLMGYKKLIYDNGETNILEVLYEKPIRNTNLKIASIINFDKLLLKITKLKRRQYSIFILMGVLIISISFFTVRFIGSLYEKSLEEKRLNLENEFFNITKLNLGIFSYQQKIAVLESNHPKNSIAVQNESHENNPKKNRLITYKGDDLIPCFLNDVAYIFTENSVTYVIDKFGNKTFSNSSLDEIYNELDESLFFRANRQFIIHIITIEKVLKYGNNQLKILINNSDANILISKNKASEFKKWLNI